jgi:hypothetical protein
MSPRHVLFAFVSSDVELVLRGLDVDDLEMAQSAQVRVSGLYWRAQMVASQTGGDRATDSIANLGLHSDAQCQGHLEAEFVLYFHTHCLALTQVYLRETKFVVSMGLPAIVEVVSWKALVNWAVPKPRHDSSLDWVAVHW